MVLFFNYFIIRISAVKRLILINRIQNKVFIYTIYICVYVYIYYVYIKYISYINMTYLS